MENHPDWLSFGPLGKQLATTQTVLKDASNALDNANIGLTIPREMRGRLSGFVDRAMSAHRKASSNPIKQI